MSFDPRSIISLIQTCQTLYDYFNDVKQSSAERQRLLDEVVSLQSALEALQRLVNVGDPASTEQLAQLLGPSQPFYEALRKTLTDVETVLRNGVPKPRANRWKVVWARLVAALRWTADKAEVKALLSDLERQKSRIMIALQHDMFKKQDGIDGKLKDHIGNEDRIKIAEFISASDYVGHRIDLLEQRLSGTGTWMIQHPEFVAWRDKEESPRTLWCYGHPGAGKSVIAALIVDHLQSMSNIVLSVFCRYSSYKFTTPFAVLRGLLRQLIEKTPEVPSAICDLYWTKTTPSPDALPDFLAEAAAVHARPIYVVIDALDECQIDIDMLRAIQQLGPSFRVLVTSRPVFREIQEAPSIQVRASDHDVLVAVDTTLSKLRHAWLDEKLKETIRAQVVDKADGMFLLASLQLRELERDVTCQRDVLIILDSLPRTLDDAYKLTFQRIREQGERKNELACRVLAVIALPLRDFNISHMRHLLAEADTSQYPEIETILQCCRGLVQKAKYDYKFVFIHYSVHEYTTTHWSELFPEHPNRTEFCLRLAVSVLTSLAPLSGTTWETWFEIMSAMAEPKDLDFIVFQLSTPAVRAALLRFLNFQVSAFQIAPFIHDPLLIACFIAYWRGMDYMIRTAPPDVQRFNDALRACRSGHTPTEGRTEYCINHINARPDMRVNDDGMVVALDSNCRRRGLSKVEDGETSADSALIRLDN